MQKGKQNTQTAATATRCFKTLELPPRIEGREKVYEKRRKSIEKIKKMKKTKYTLSPSKHLCNNANCPKVIEIGTGRKDIFLLLFFFLKKSTCHI